MEIEALAKKVCELQAKHTLLELALAKDLEQLEEVKLKKLHRTLNSKSKQPATAPRVAESLLSYLSSLCSKQSRGRKLSNPKLKRIKTVLGTTFVFTGHTGPEWEVVEEVAPSIASKVTAFGRAALTTLMNGALAAAKLIGPYVSSALDKLSVLCYGTWQGTAMCVLVARLVCMYLQSLNNASLSTLQWLAVKPLQALCNGVLGKNSAVERQNKERMDVAKEVIEEIKGRTDISSEKKKSFVAEAQKLAKQMTHKRLRGSAARDKQLIKQVGKKK